MDTQIPYQSAAADRITDLEVALGQARDAQETAETAQRRAEERAQREADRADGAENLARALLDTHHITPAMADLGIDPLVPSRADVEAIADVLADDWAHGTEIDSLDADTAVRDWATDRGLL